MEHLGRRDREFVAIGAALGSNCIPCVINHIREARKVGITDEQIRAAVEVAAAIRKMPAAQVVATAYAQLGDEVPLQDEGDVCGPAECCS